MDASDHNEPIREVTRKLDIGPYDALTTSTDSLKVSAEGTSY